MKISIMIVLNVFFLMFGPLYVFSIGLENEKPIRLFSEEDRQEYIHAQQVRYQDEINELERLGCDETLVDLYLVDLIDHNLLKFRNDQSLYENEINKLNLFALCYLAAERKSIAPLGKLGNYLSLINGGPRIPIRLIHGKNSKALELKDYPVLYLYVQNGDKSVPFLMEIIQDSNIDFFNRFIAYAALYHVDSDRTRELSESLLKQLNQQQQDCIRRFHEDTKLLPYQLPQFPNARVEKRLERRNNPK